MIKHINYERATNNILRCVSAYLLEESAEFKEIKAMLLEIEELKEDNKRLIREVIELNECIVHNDKAHLFFINNQAKLIEKYQKAISILEDRKHILKYNGLKETYELGWLTQEEYELIKEVFEVSKNVKPTKK